MQSRPETDFIVGRQLQINVRSCEIIYVFSEAIHFNLRTDLNNVKEIYLRKYTDLRTTVPFVTAHLEIFHCTHHPVIPKSDLYFTFCSTLNALSKRTSK